MENFRANHQAKVSAPVSQKINSSNNQKRESDVAAFYYATRSRHLDLNQLMKEAFTEKNNYQ